MFVGAHQITASSERPERRKKSPSILYRRPWEELVPYVLSLFFVGTGMLRVLDREGGVGAVEVRLTAGAALKMNDDRSALLL